MPEHPFLHADAQRRFRVVSSVEELQRALDAPWDKWAVFLHPEQRQIVERDYNGPARVSGSAGTGKTIVALHRAAHMARRSPGARVLVATFSDPLANALRAKLARLVGNEPRIAERIEVFSLDALAVRLYAARFGRPRLIPRDGLKKLLEEAANGATQPFPVRFLLSEWEQVVDAWQLATWEAYRDVPRLGRRVRLPEARRAVLWDIFSRVRVTLTNRGLSTRAGLFESLSADLAAGAPTPFNFAVIDEAQDLSVSQMRFLGALGGNRPNALFLAGDIGQRIFQQPFSWKALGVDVRGRSRTLRVNYRTSHQIREQADRLLDRELVDADGVTEDRSRTISVFNGPPPLVRVFETQEQESRAVGAWLAEQTAAGLQSHEIGLFVRSEAQLPRAESAVKAAGLQYRVLDEQIAVAAGQVSLGTMHLAKGLEFRAVAVMACDDEILPLQSRIESVGDDGDLEEVYETERHLLYVACTRARDLLSVSGVMPVSEFLDDLRVTRRPGGVTS